MELEQDLHLVNLSRVFTRPTSQPLLPACGACLGECSGALVARRRFTGVLRRLVAESGVECRASRHSTWLVSPARCVEQGCRGNRWQIESALGLDVVPLYGLHA